MFRLLEMFSATKGEKNSIAPTIFKNMAHIFVENHDETTTREYIMINLMKVFKREQTIPVGFIVEPLVKQL